VSHLVVRDVRVFDGVSDRPIERASVVVEGAHVREVVVGPVAAPAGVRVLDGRGRTLLPGFVDMHSHLVSEPGARLYLANGVTAVRYAGNDPDAVLALRERIEAGRVPGPRVFSLGPLLDGVSPDYPAMSWPLASGAEARLAVAARPSTGSTASSSPRSPPWRWPGRRWTRPTGSASASPARPGA
jgi:hypothetical protein